MIVSTKNKYRKRGVIHTYANPKTGPTAINYLFKGGPIPYAPVVNNAEGGVFRGQDGGLYYTKNLKAYLYHPDNRRFQDVYHYNPATLSWDAFHHFTVAANGKPGAVFYGNVEKPTYTEDEIDYPNISLVGKHVHSWDTTKYSPTMLTTQTPPQNPKRTKPFVSPYFQIPAYRSPR